MLANGLLLSSLAALTCSWPRPGWRSFTTTSAVALRAWWRLLSRRQRPRLGTDIIRFALAVNRSERIQAGRVGCSPGSGDSTSSVRSNISSVLAPFNQASCVYCHRYYVNHPNIPSSCQGTISSCCCSCRSGGSNTLNITITISSNNSSSNSNNNNKGSR